MNCEQFEGLVSDYLDGQLSASEREAFEEHRTACLECPDLLVQVQKVIALCRAFPEAEPPVTLAERILSATLGERRRVSLSRLFDLSNLRRLLNPQFAVGVALVLCFFGLVVRVASPAMSGEEGASQAILSRVDAYTHKIYSQGLKLYNAKNQIVAEYNYLKTTLFNQIDYHLSQIIGQAKEPAEKPTPPAGSKTSPKEDKKSSLFLFFV